MLREGEALPSVVADVIYTKCDVSIAAVEDGLAIVLFEAARGGGGGAAADTDTNEGIRS